MNESDFLKYLDNEMTPEERRDFEKQIQRHPELQQKLEEVKQQRNLVFEGLTMLNPSEAIPEQDFESFLKPEQKPRKMFYPIFRIAAALILIITSVFSIIYFSAEKPDNQVAEARQPAIEDEQAIDSCNIDYYISPNRCWNRRELIWIEIKINN